MNTLLEKNKANIEQIKDYEKSCKSFHPSVQVSSDENPSAYNRNDSSKGSKLSLRKSFVISKRKPSFAFESPSDRSEAELTQKDLLPFSRTTRNFSKTKKPEVSSGTKSRPKQNNNSKKIFVVKSPMMF